MKRIFKWIFLMVPILAWLSLVGSCLYKNIRVDREIQETDGLVWENNGKPLTVRVKKEDRGEISDYTILVLDASERTVHESKIAFNRDMFGGGFVKEMNADDDPVPEVLAWGFHEGEID